MPILPPTHAHGVWRSKIKLMIERLSDGSHAKTQSFSAMCKSCRARCRTAGHVLEGAPEGLPDLGLVLLHIRGKVVVRHAAVLIAVVLPQQRAHVRLARRQPQPLQRHLARGTQAPSITHNSFNTPRTVISSAWCGTLQQFWQSRCSEAGLTCQVLQRSAFWGTQQCLDCATHVWQQRRLHAGQSLSAAPRPPCTGATRAGHGSLQGAGQHCLQPGFTSELSSLSSGAPAK